MRSLKLKKQINRFYNGRPNASFTYNAKHHTIFATSAGIWTIRLEVVPCTQHITELALSEFWLFVALKKHLKSVRLTCDKQVQAATVIFFKNSLKISQRLFQATGSTKATL
jgi:hypothetical protein